MEKPVSRSPIRTVVHLTRLHIIAIACLTSLTFGWLMTGRHMWLPVLFCALDWFVVNFVNRVVDLAEDTRNGVVGTDLVARHGRRYEILGWGVLAVGLAVGQLLAPELTVWRLLFSAVGLFYNYRWIPLGRRRTRFKELYFWKNFMSGVLFLLSTIAYPLASGHAQPSSAWLLVLIGFFLPLEITYEIIYDLRDVQGDAAQGVPTYPVVHGLATSYRLVYSLLGLSALAVAVGGISGVWALQELVLLGGVIQQLIYFHYRIRQEATAERCVFLTWLGAAQVASYNLWIVAGLPTTWGTAL